MATPLSQLKAPSEPDIREYNRTHHHDVEGQAPYVMLCNKRVSERIKFYKGKRN